MWRFMIGLAALVAAFAIGPGVRAQAGPDSIRAVYGSGGMFWSIEDGGTGRFRTSDREDYTFPVTRQDYARIRELMDPYRAEGLRCDDPDYGGSEGYLAWRTGDAETRRPHESLCYTDAARAAGRSLERAYYAMAEMGETRHVPPTLPAPDRITLSDLYWGRTTQSWSVPRGGEAVWTGQDGAVRTFAVSAADFDRLRDLFRPWEGVRFECRRVITDGPYGRLVWSQAGHDDQELGWDAGCVTGDADEVFRRVDQAKALLVALRDAR